MLAQYKIKERLIQKSKSPFLRSLGVYTLLNFFLKGLSFLITPLFTNYISPAEFGNLNLYLNSINLISPLIILSTNSIAVDYFKLDKKELGNQMSTYILFSFYISIAIAIIISIFHSFLTGYFKFDFIYLLLVPFICFFNLIIDIGFIFFRNENMLKKITVLTVFRTILEISLSVYLIIYLLKGSEGRIISMLIATTIVFVISFIFVYHFVELKLSFNFDYIKKEYKFWLSTLVGFLFVVSFQIADKYIVKYFCTADELGQYTLATSFGFIILTISSAINSAYHPQLFRDLSNKIANNLLLNKIKLISVFIVIFALLTNIIVIFLYEFIVNNSYYQSWIYYFLISIIFAIWSIMSMLYGIFNFYKMKQELIYYGLVSMFIYLPIFCLIVSKYKILGALVSQLSYIILLLYFTIYLVKNKIKNQ